MNETENESSQPRKWKNRFLDPTIHQESLKEIDRHTAMREDPLTFALGEQGPIVEGAMATAGAAVGIAQGVGGLIDAVTPGELIPDELESFEGRHPIFKPQTAVGQIGSSMLQFMLPFGVVGKAGKALTMAATAGKAAPWFGRFVVGSGLNSAIVFSGQDANLSGMLRNEFGFTDPITGFLATDPEDPELLNRGRLFLEDMLVGAPLGVITDLVVGPTIMGARSAARGKGFKAGLQESVHRTLQDLKPEVAAKAGLIPPEVAEDLGARFSAIPEIDPQELAGAERAARIAEMRMALATAGQDVDAVDQTVEKTLIPVFDRIAAVWASAGEDRSIEKFYGERLVSVKFDGAELAAAADSLNQGQAVDMRSILGTSKELQLDDGVPLDKKKDKIPPGMPKEEYAESVLAKFSVEDGWAPMGYSIETAKDGKESIAWKSINYDFNRVPKKVLDSAPPGKKKAAEAAYQEEMSTKHASKLAAEFREIQRRAASTDNSDDARTARYILAQSTWYRGMTREMRERFGTGGDLMIDLLGALSPQTPVRDNYLNAIQALSRFSRGEYDGMIQKYVKWKENEYPKLLDEWVKNNERLAAEGKPKAPPASRPSFSKSFPEFDKALKGKFYDVSDTLDIAGSKIQTLKQALTYHFDPKEVKKKLALVREYNPELVQQGYLQTVDQALPPGVSVYIPNNYGINTEAAMAAMADIWLYSINSPKAGNFRQNLAGVNGNATIDVWAARTLQRIADEFRAAEGEQVTGRIPPKAEESVPGSLSVAGGADVRRKKYLAGEEYAGGAFGYGQKVFEKAAAELGMSADDLQAVVWFSEKERWARNGWTNEEGARGSFEEWTRLVNPTRHVVGFTTATQTFTPTAKQLRRVAERLKKRVFEENEGVISVVADVTYGRYKNTREPTLNIEVVGTDRFDPDTLLRLFAEEGKKAGQKSVFVSRVHTPAEPIGKSRPQLELMFSKETPPEIMEEIGEELSKRLPGGYTALNDPRNGQQIGFRQQFIPEYTGLSGRHIEAGAAAAEDIFYDAMSFAVNKYRDHFVSGSVHRVDTIVIGEGGVPYGQFVGRSRRAASASGKASRAGGSSERSGLSLRRDSSGAGAAADPDAGGSRAAFVDQRSVRRGEWTQRLDNARRAGGDEEGLRVPPSRHFSRLWHFSGASRVAEGLKKKFAGSGKAGAERGRLRKLADGSVDPDSAVIHAYAPGSRIEVGLGQHLHALEGDGGYNLLNMNGRPAAAFWRSAVAEAEDIGGDPHIIFQREVSAAGYDGIYHPELDETDWKSVQLFRDIDPSEISSSTELDGETIRAMQDGRATLFQTESPLEAYVSGGKKAPKGQISFENGRAFIKLFQDGDASTIIHEGGHLIRRLLREIDEDIDAKIKAAYGIDGSRSAADIAGEEAFALDFEKYIIKGEYKHESMKPIFERMKEILHGIYRAFIEGADLEGIEINKEAREVFDFIFGDAWNRFDMSGRPSSIPPLKPTPKVIDARRSYLAANGVDADSLQPEYLHIDEERARAIADAYEEAQHNPGDPAVQLAYKAFKEQTAAQYQHLLDSGFSIRFAKKDPYGSSQAMIEDVQRHNRLYVFLTEPGTLLDDHPLAEKTGIVVDTIEGDSVHLTYSDLFRAVHDIFGHAAYGYQFGPRGEESAWLAHSQMYGKVARPAMTAETRGQNNWVNAGKHLRNEGGKVPKQGEPGYVLPKDRPYAPQKAFLMPEWATDPKGRPDADVLRQSLRDSIFGALKKQVPLPDAVKNGFNLHINYGRINTTDDVLRVMAEIEPLAQELIDSKIGKTVTLEEIRADAEALLDSPEAASGLVEQLAKDEAAYADLAPKLVALRMLHAGASQRVVELSHKIKAAGKSIDRDEHLLASFEQAILAVVRLDDLRGTLQKAAARTVTSGRVVVDAGLSDAVTKAIRGVRGPAEQAVLDAADKAAKEGLKELSERLTGGKAGRRTIGKVVDAVIEADKVGLTDKAIRKIRKASADPSVWEAAMEVWRAGLLSGVRTFGINFISGGIQTATLPAFRAVGALAAGDKAEMARAISTYAHLAGTAKDMIQTLIQRSDSPVDARRIFKMVANEGTQPLTASSAIEDRFAFQAKTFGLSPDSRAGQATDKAGRIIRLPFRVNMAFEEVWSQLNYIAFVRQKADEVVRAEVWDNPAIADHLKPETAKRVHDSYVEAAFSKDGLAASDPRGNWTHDDARRYAQTVNFTQDLLGGFSQSFGELRTNHPSLMLLLPFHKAPSNLLRDSRRMLPGLGFAQRAGEIRRQAAQGITEAPWEKNVRNGQAIVGTAAGIMLASMAAEGVITGGGPVNPVERARLMESGWRPYSFVLTDKDGTKSYLGFNRLDPFGATIGLVADAVEVFPYLEEHRRDEIAGKIVGGIANNLGARSYLRSLHETFRALFQSQHYGPSYIRNFAATLVPNFIGSAVTGEDESFREARTIVDAWKRRLPGLSKTLPPRRNILGDPITPNGGWLPFVSPDSPVARTASPLAFSQGVSDPVYQEFAELRLAMALPSRRLGNTIDMTRFRNEEGQDAYDRLQELTGTLKHGGMTLRERLHDLISSSSYQSLPKTTGNRDIDSQNPRVKAVQGLIRGYRNMARAEVLKEYPELRAAYELLVKSRVDQDLSFFEAVQQQ